LLSSDPLPVVQAKLVALSLLQLLVLLAVDVAWTQCQVLGVMAAAPHPELLKPDQMREPMAPNL
jgi:hypothetical protein